MNLIEAINGLTNVFDDKVKKLTTLKEPLDEGFNKPDLGEYEKYYTEIKPEDIDGYEPGDEPSNTKGYEGEFEHIAWIEAKDEYYDTLSNEGFEILELAKDTGGDLIGLYSMYEGVDGPASVYDVSIEYIEDLLSNGDFESLNEATKSPLGKEDAIKEIKKIIKNHQKYITHNGDKAYLAHSGASAKIAKIAKEANLSAAQVNKLVTLKELVVEAAGDILSPRTTEVEKIIDKIDSVYSKVNPQTGDVSWVEVLLDKHNAGDDNGPEGYFTAMSNEDILACWNDIKEVLCQNFKQKLDDPEVNLYDFFRFL